MTYLLMLSRVIQAAVRDEQWSLASRLFDQAEERHTKGRQDRFRGEGMGGDNAVEDKSQRLAGTPGESDVRPYDRGRRELRKTAIDTMAPTALTYRLALQVGRLQFIYRAHSMALARRQYVLVRKNLVSYPLGQHRYEPARNLQTHDLSL